MVKLASQTSSRIRAIAKVNQCDQEREREREREVEG